ncbi:thymidylate kinase [Dickeya phage vB_DsoM_JA29]|uniref:dTMP kinase n=1 Tax=Dickeya phage vB_DsoM_JA29 TaxID=2283031 RepID=A0A384ZX96_9CAUD|nr:thymidylate kinase [Dickeya phage vB_DsoM_JA29]AXG66835.1 putative dTMP kinase [Dickeya phage vB_DsoM_JA29]
MKKYILLEGTEGVGKSTTAEILESSLRLRDMSVIRVREPGTTPLAEQLRNIALHDNNVRSPTTEMLLFLAARSSLMDYLAESSADVVISDRGWPSTWALQVKDDKTQVLFDRTVNILRPDVQVVSILLTCTYDTYVSRRGDKREGSDNIEARMVDAETFEMYQDRYRNLPGGYDAVFSTDNTTPTEIVGEILKCLSQ